MCCHLHSASSFARLVNLYALPLRLRRPLFDANTVCPYPSHQRRAAGNRNAAALHAAAVSRAPSRPDSRVAMSSRAPPALHLRFCGRGIWCMGVNRGKVWRERVGYMTVRVSDATHVHVFGAKKQYVPAVRARQR